MLKEIQDDLRVDMQSVIENIHTATQSNVNLINEIGEYALNQPGRKLVRPTILILLAKTLGYTGKKHIQL